MQDSILNDGIQRDPVDETFDMDEDDQDEVINPSTFRCDIDNYPIDKDHPFHYTFYEKK